MYELGLFVLAFLIRVFNLRLFPIVHDEATWTFGSLNNFDRFMGIPVSCFKGYIQPLFSYLVFFSSKIFVTPEFILRVPAVVIGSATVTLVYVLGKEMYGKKTGLLSSLLLCLLPWHVIQSRVGVSLILTPFFGCLVFLSLYKSIIKKSNSWFLLSWVFLGIGSFYTYQSSLLFIPLFMIMLLSLRKELYWLNLKVFVLSILALIIIIYPLLYLQIVGKIPEYLGRVYRMYYNDVDFSGGLPGLLSKSFINFRGNIFESIKGLFFTEYFFQFGRALHYPLLINFLSLIIIILSMIISLCRRAVADKIILIWLILGYLGSISGVRFHAARYIIIVLPVMILFIGRGIAEIFNRIPNAVSFRRKMLLSLGVIVFFALFYSEILQLKHYYSSAPYDLEECRFNSYGCREAAAYLSRVGDIEKYKIIPDVWMEPLFVYFHNYSSNKTRMSNYNNEFNVANKGLTKGVYYIVWAPESHPKDYREGMYSRSWEDFRNNYSNAMPIYTVYYPNNYPAIYIFKVKAAKNDFLGT